MNFELERILKRHGFRFAHSLGQNFIMDEQFLSSAVDEAGIGEGDCVLEIGAGAGTLTRALAGRAKKVLALEIDRRLMPVLNEYLDGCENVDIVNADVMKCDLRALTQQSFGGGAFCVCANLPYYITTPVIILLLESGLPIESITIMVQLEVAQRMTASPGGKDYGALTIAVQYPMRARIAARVPASMFTPAPKVDSALVVLQKRDEPPVRVKSEAVFFRVARAAFAMRRKTMANNLCAAFSISKGDASALLEALGFGASIRGECLSMQDMARIADALVAKNE